MNLIQTLLNSHQNLQENAQVQQLQFFVASDFVEVELILPHVSLQSHDECTLGAHRLLLCQRSNTHQNSCLVVQSVAFQLSVELIHCVLVVVFLSLVA